MNQATSPSGGHCPATGCEPDATACTKAEDCDDGDFCNGDEVCDDEFGCQEAEHPRECVDSDPCTVDACDSSANMCTFTCDPTIPGCEEECPTDYFPGCFNIVPMLSYSCAFGMVGYNFNQICCTVEGLSLNCSASGVGADGTLSEVGYSGGAHFEVTTTVEGGCTEDYSFTGDFTDPDTFSGLWYVHFTQTDGFSCTMGGCTDQTVYVTGTRVP